LQIQRRPVTLHFDGRMRTWLKSRDRLLAWLRHKYMYNGRAGGVGMAIEMHGGEATASRNGWFLLDEADRNALFRFLLTL